MFEIFPRSLIKNLNYWFSGQYTSYENMRVYEFDTLYYREDDPSHLNKQNMVQPWDDQTGFIGFGFDKTWDVLGKLAYKLTDQIRTSLSSRILSNTVAISTFVLCFCTDKTERYSGFSSKISAKKLVSSFNQVLSLI